MKFFNVALGIVLAATTLTASAQKSYTEGALTVSSLGMQGAPAERKIYFTTDSSSMSFDVAMASIKVLGDTKQTLFAVFVDVPAASIKKVAIATPAEIEQMTNDAPKFTFAPATDTKVISGFNCKKVIATDSKTNKTYDVWITSDITLPKSVVPKYYENVGGTPIQYTGFQQGQSAQITIIKVTDEKAPAGAFAISPDYEKITMDDLKAMSGGH